MEGFGLDNRDEILSHLNDPPILVEPLQPGDDPDLDFVVCYRSLIVFPRESNDWIEGDDGFGAGGVFVREIVLPRGGFGAV